MLLQNFTEQVLLQAGDLRNAPLFFYQDFADFFKQLATPSIGNLQNGVVGPTSFATTLDAGTLTINPGVLFARFTDPANAPDFPDYCFGSNLSDGAVTLPASDGTLVANFNYDSVEGTRYIFAPAATGIPATPVSIPVVRFLTVSFSIITGAPTIYQCPLYEISGATLTDVRNILLTSGAGTGDGQTIQVTGSTISAITPAGAGSGLVSQAAINQTIGGIKTFSNNVVCSATAPVNKNHLTRKDYVDADSILPESFSVGGTGFINVAYFNNAISPSSLYIRKIADYLSIAGSFRFTPTAASTATTSIVRIPLIGSLGETFSLYFAATGVGVGFTSDSIGFYLTSASLSYAGSAPFYMYLTLYFTRPAGIIASGDGYISLNLMVK